MPPAADFSAHNDEQAAVWAAYHARTPIRVPMRLGVSSRYTVFNAEANPAGHTFEAFFSNPRVMFEQLLAKQHFIRHRLWCDQEMGLPEKWTVAVDFQNSHEALWYGCPIHFRDGEVPDTTPLLNDDNKQMLFDVGLPEPFPQTGWAARAWSTTTSSGNGPQMATSSTGGLSRSPGQCPAWPVMVSSPPPSPCAIPPA